MKLYDFQITMYKIKYASKMEKREIAIANFTLTLENTALHSWHGKMIAPSVDSGSWSAPGIAQAFFLCTSGSWKLTTSKSNSSIKQIWLSDEDPLLFKSLATSKILLEGFSLFPPVIGMEGEGFVSADADAYLKMNDKEYENELLRRVNLFRWKLIYRVF